MTTTDQIADATVVEPGTAAGGAPAAAGADLVVRADQAQLAVTPNVEASELVARLETIKTAMQDAMVDGIDFGKVPGVSKPTLLKPGAEKLGVLFQLDVQITNEQTFGPGEHLTVTSRAVAFHIPTGKRVGYGEGLCTTREKKYAKRRADRVCPICNQPAIIKGKAEYGGGWVCFKRKDGCGEKFPDDDQCITSQQVGDIENPDLPDAWNTVIKMAEKRARVDVILAVTGASALFTQDVEDSPSAAAAEASAIPEWAGPLDLSSDEAKAFRQALGQLVGPDAALPLYEQLLQDCERIPKVVAGFITSVNYVRARQAATS